MSCAQCAESVHITFLWNPCHIRAGSLERSCWVPKNAERQGAHSRVYYIGAAPQYLGLTGPWRSDIPKDSDKSQCKRTRLIAASLLRLCALTWARQRSFSDPISFLLRVNKNAESWRIVVEWSSWRPYRDKWRCAAVGDTTAHTLTFWIFHGCNRVALRTQPRCDRDLTIHATCLSGKWFSEDNYKLNEMHYMLLRIHYFISKAIFYNISRIITKRICLKFLPFC